MTDLSWLTGREREVLALLAEGHSNRSIAGRLFTTERTVETHVSRIFTKLDLAATPGMHRRVLAARLHLVSVPARTTPEPMAPTLDTTYSRRRPA